MKLETQIILEDVHVLGFLQLPQYKFSISYELNWSGRVAGIVRGDPVELKQAFSDLERNVTVGSRDLIESIKKVRTEIFQKKSKSR